MADYLSQGTKIGYGATPTYIAQVVAIDGPDGETPAIDATDLDSTDGHRVFIPGLIENGELTARVKFDMGQTSHQALFSKYNARTVEKWTLLFPSGGTVFGNAYINRPPNFSARVGEIFYGTLSIKFTDEIDTTNPS